MHVSQLLLSCLLVAATFALDAPPTIDDFQTTTFLVVEEDAGPSTFQCEGACLFGERTIEVVKTGGALGASMNLDLTPAGQEPGFEVGVLGYSNDVGVTSEATLSYSGTPGANLAEGGRDAFVIGACSLDQSRPVFIDITADANSLSSGAVATALDDVCDQDSSQSLVLRIPFDPNTLEQYSSIENLEFQFSTQDTAIDAQFRWICTASGLTGRTISLPVPLNGPDFTVTSELQNPPDFVGSGTDPVVRNIMFLPQGTAQPANTKDCTSGNVVASSTNPAATVTVINTPTNVAASLDRVTEQAVFIDFMLPGDIVTISYDFSCMAPGLVLDMVSQGIWLTDVVINNDMVEQLPGAEFFARTNADVFLQGVNRCSVPVGIPLQFVMQAPPTTAPPTTAPPTTLPPTTTAPTVAPTAPPTDAPTTAPPVFREDLCVVPVFDQTTGQCTCQTFPCEPLADGTGFRCMTDAWYCIPVFRTGGWPENPTFYTASWMAVTGETCTCPIFT